MLKFSIIAVAVAGLTAGQVLATPIQTSGAGSAVTSVDRSATFDLVATETDLTNYTENNLRITVNKYAYTGFDPSYGNGGFSGGFHYPYGGASGDTSISTTDGLKIFGVEFNVGNGIGGAGTTLVDWNIFDNSVSVGSGTISIPTGGVVGFYDTNGFDTLFFADRRNSVNAVALDNLHVQLASQVPEPASLALLGIGLVGLVTMRHKQRS